MHEGCRSGTLKRLSSGPLCFTYSSNNSLARWLILKHFAASNGSTADLCRYCAALRYLRNVMERGTRRRATIGTYLQMAGYVGHAAGPPSRTCRRATPSPDNGRGCGSPVAISVAQAAEAPTEPGGETCRATGCNSATNSQFIR